MTEKTRARKLAEYMEKSRLKPATTAEERAADALKGPRMLRAPAEAYDAVRAIISPQKPRNKEEMDELTRESARALRTMKKGGAVKSSASKRADGVAQRGKTRGKMR